MTQYLSNDANRGLVLMATYRKPHTAGIMVIGHMTSDVA